MSIEIQLEKSFKIPLFSVWHEKSMAVLFYLERKWMKMILDMMFHTKNTVQPWYDSINNLNISYKILLDS